MKIKTEPRAWTTEEVAKMIVNQTLVCADYWARQPNKTPQEVARGTAFGILSMLDGSCLNLPGFDLVPTPDPTDKAYCIEQGENYFTNEPVSFALHEMFHEIEQTFDKSQ